MKSKKTILQLLKERVVILDGAMGSILINQGLKAGNPPEYWNISHPEKIQKIHSDYFEAGADVILTNTFGGSRMKLSAHKHGDNIEKYNQTAVELAIEVCPEDCYIAGDIGPSGAFLPPVGTIAIEDFYENFLEQAGFLSDAGVDFFFVETMVDIHEAEAAVKAIKECSNLPIFASITYKKTKRGFYTIMGNSIEYCVHVLEKAGVDVIGANCTLGSDEMIDLISILKQKTSFPISAKPNAGQPMLLGGKTIYPTDSVSFARDIEEIVKIGARVVGGCCGSNSEYIREISSRIKGEYIENSKRYTN